MARKLRIVRSLSYVDGSTTIATIPSFTDEITQAADLYTVIPKEVTTTEVSVSLSALTTNGEVMIKNLGPTNYIEVGTTTTDYPIRIKAGRTAGPFQVNAGKTLYLKANSATCRAEIYAWND